ncbi:MAG TPA: TonB-dependent receptor plug domain-containing protein [Niabella sp.]|nr:TonB-dependent receptor plug domain-containing protein [Niabella sp.]
MRKTKLLLMTVLLLFTSIAWSQTRTITGTVTGEGGAPISNASVIVKGTSVGTVTSEDGSFFINVAPTAKSLVISAVGMADKEVAIGNAANLSINLSTSGTELGEVVVVAYGTAKKRSITGSVSSISAADLENRAITNVTAALQGAAPGINVLASNGQPGASAGVRIRGFGSFSASNSPLYVLDGSVYDGSIGDINQNDIESVSVLKDASSSALYGSRGANGVVIITTKKGKFAKPTFSASLVQGYSERGIPEYETVNAMQYYPLVWQGIKNNLMYTASPALTEAAAAAKASADVYTNLVYNPFNVPGDQLVGTDGKLNPSATLLYNDFDWYAPMVRTGMRTDANMSLSGRNDKSDYYFSLGYLNDKGFIIGSDFRRFNARMNVNSQVKSWLKTGLNLSGVLSNVNNASDAATDNGNSFVNAFSFARGMGPIYPVHAYDATGQPIINDLTKEQWYDYGLHPGARTRPQGASPGRHVLYETLW